jgi:hypothetical protein
MRLLISALAVMNRRFAPADENLGKLRYDLAKEGLNWVWTGPLYRLELRIKGLRRYAADSFRDQEIMT